MQSKGVSKLFSNTTVQKHHFFGAQLSLELGKVAGSCDGKQSTGERSYPTSEVRDRSQEDPMIKGQRPRGATPLPRLGAAARRSCPKPEARGGGWEEQPHEQGAVAAQAQKGLEELFHVQGWEGRR